ncbi:MAG: hypothetical protein WCE30_04120 [Mycobacterium sp.]
MDVGPGGSVTVLDVDSHNEREQARRFAAILRGEIGDMRQVVAIAERKRHARQHVRTEQVPPERIARLTARIEEADRILGALTVRFKLS